MSVMSICGISFLINTDEFKLSVECLLWIKLLIYYRLWIHIEIMII